MYHFEIESIRATGETIQLGGFNADSYDEAIRYVLDLQAELCTTVRLYMRDFGGREVTIGKYVYN